MVNDTEIVLLGHDAEDPTSARRKFYMSTDQVHADDARGAHEVGSRECALVSLLEASATGRPDLPGTAEKFVDQAVRGASGFVVVPEGFQ